MTHPHTSENPGVGAPGIEALSKNLPDQNTRGNDDAQLISRHAVWEFCTVLVACAASAAAAASFGSVVEVEIALLKARLALIEAIGAFKALKHIEGTP